MGVILTCTVEILCRTNTALVNISVTLLIFPSFPSVVLDSSDQLVSQKLEQIYAGYLLLKYIKQPKSGTISINEISVRR